MGALRGGIMKSNRHCTASSKLTRVRIQDLLIGARARDTEAIPVAHHGGGIDDHQKIRGAAPGRGLAQKGPDRVVGIMEVNPFESLGTAIEREEGRLVPIDRVEPANKALHPGMGLMLE